ncbi:MAG TPA: STAS domain-containing protein [Myxococcaceae bacterium]|nr:STAS domain-containing protein [Myxococcaceae bacterium]
MEAPQRLRALLDKRSDTILERWLAHLATEGRSASSTIRPGGPRTELAALLKATREGISAASDPGVDLKSQGWSELRETLAEVSQAGARRGVNPADTISEILALKRPLFELLEEEDGRDQAFSTVLWAGRLVDAMSLHVASTHQQTREAIIVRQQHELLELSTPVITLWEGILALPIIGTLDSTRTQTVMESLLQRIVETNADIAIIDITGVPTVDTLTAQHLLKTVTATRLMGGECIISGIRPQIAQTLVQLGVDLGDVITRSSLASALALALQRRRLTISPIPAGQKTAPSARP